MANYLKSVKSLESQLLHEEVKIPIYFILETGEVNDYYEYIENDSLASSDGENKQNVSAFKALLNSIITNGFQFVINSPQSQAISHTSSEFQAINLQAKLNGAIGAGASTSPLHSNSNSDEFADTETATPARNNIASSKIPTIIITAHYDAFGMATVCSIYFFYNIYWQFKIFKVNSGNLIFFFS